MPETRHTDLQFQTNIEIHVCWNVFTYILFWTKVLVKVNLKR